MPQPVRRSAQHCRLLPRWRLVPVLTSLRTRMRPQVPGRSYMVRVGHRRAAGLRIETWWSAMDATWLCGGRRDGYAVQAELVRDCVRAVSRPWLRLGLIPVNKQERTYMILRDRIHSGSIAPLERLNIDALARELGVSPIPVREALRRLEAEGWVRFTPNVGAVVSPVDSTTWEQAMVSLAILEGAATADAQQHL